VPAQDATATRRETASRDKLSRLVEQGRANPAELGKLRAKGDALAIEVEGDVAFEWRLMVLRTVMASPPDGDAVRELYGEMVDRYRNDAKRLAALKPIGVEIRKLETDGTLPSAMVVRSERRRRGTSRH
jgi:hypothetical protein